MPTEADLTARLHDPSAFPSKPIDTDAVLRRVRRRRLPRKIVAGTMVSLAAVGIGVAGFGSIPFSGNSGGSASTSEAGSPEEGDAATSYDGAAEGSQPGAAPSDGIARAPIEKLNPCGGELADVAPSGSGLTLTTEFPDAVPASGGSVEGVVRMTNTGALPASGVTAAAPAVTVSADGVVLWHSNGPMIMSATLVDLQPGESLEYQATFTAVRCGTEDETSEQFREDLPPLTPGRYQISAAIEFAPDSTESRTLDVITGPLEPIELQ